MATPTKSEMEKLGSETERHLKNYFNVYEALEDMLDELESLMDESEGVTGLHQNGDVAPWSELLENGRFPWIGSFDRAKKVIKEIKRQW